MKAKFTIFNNETLKRVSDEVYSTAEEANHDYFMNHGRTHVGLVQMGKTGKG